MLDNSSPSWDQAHYLDVTWHYRQALSDHGPIELLRAINSVDPTRGPLYPILMLPITYVFGPGPRSGLILNFLLAPIFYLSAGQIAMTVFRDWRARLLTILFVATMPMMVGLYHNVLQDFLLITLTTLSILLLLKTELFTKRGLSLGLGAVMGLGTLTKVTFPAFILGPLIIVAVRTIAKVLTARRSGGSPEPRKIGLNVAGTVGVYLAFILPWYLLNLSETIEYVEWTTEPGLGAGPEDPFTAHAIISFTAGLMNSNISWVLGFSAIVAGLLCLPSIVTWSRQRPLRTQRLIDIGMLVTWFLIPYLAVALGHNQDVRLMAAAAPALAILLAGAIVAIRWRGLRIVLVTVTAFALVYQTAARVVKIEPSFLPDYATVSIGSQFAAVPLASDTLGYEQLPGADRATPVIRFMEMAARAGHPTEAIPPQVVCMLESEPIVNINTFTFLADSRGDPFTVTELLVKRPDGSDLDQSLMACDLALYVKQPSITADQRGTRLALVNTEVAARFMTPERFKYFNGPSKTFYIGPSSPDKAEPEFLSIENSGEYVRVLSRRKGPSE